MIGIIGAMDEEVAMLKEKLTEVQVETKAAMDFYKGKLEGKDVVVVRSGIGKVNAAMCAQILADVYHADHVINTGIAGSLKAEINMEILCCLQMLCSMIWMPGHLAMSQDRFQEWIRFPLRQMRKCFLLQRNAVKR